MAIDTFRIVAFCLEITRCHPRDLFQGLQIILGDVVVMVVCATDVGACICAIQEVDVA